MPTDADFVSIKNPLTEENQLIIGGSFFHAPMGMPDIFFTINLMEEKPELTSDMYVPVRDFSVPSSPSLFEDAFEELFQDGRTVYVGCWGGIGRTGLFMACLLKYLGHADPLGEVREKHHPHAVETEGQLDFLEKFPVRQAPPPKVSPPSRHC